MNGLFVLREVAGLPETVVNDLLNDRALIEKDDGTVWVNNDRPWDAEMSYFILEHTSGRFVVSDAQGGFIAGPYRSLDKAERARASVKMVVTVDVDEDPDEESLAEHEATASFVASQIGEGEE